MVNANTILLCGGRINYSNLPIHTNVSNSMIPINGKPVISWILEDLIGKNMKEATVVLRQENKSLKDFLLRAFQNRFILNIVELEESNSIIESLAAGLKEIKNNNPTQVILGDTLIKDSFAGDSDFVYVHEVEESQRWCIAVYDSNNRVIEYIDKQDHIAKPYMALCGYYYFRDTLSLKKSLQATSERSKTQMSDLLLAYQQTHPMHIKKSNQWYDFGNIDNLIYSKQRLLQSRFFNSLSIDPILNTITKVSEFDKKLRDELNWYKNLPRSLQVLTPRIISEQEIDGKLNLVQEYYGYPTLAELYLFSDLGEENWQSIFRRLLTLHQAFHSYEVVLEPGDLKSIYLDKTFERIENLCQNKYWQELFAAEEISFNGEKLKNFYTLKPWLERAIDTLSENQKGCVIHGDFCFSNILYDLSNQIIRLIDPRGSFGQTGIYGDPRYDMAKLRHSIAGYYDYIVSDLFEISESEGAFAGTIFTHQAHHGLGEIFDELLEQFGYDSKEVKLIEGLLFISMLPLHEDKPNRQKMMYVTGIQRLNQIICA